MPNRMYHYLCARQRIGYEDTYIIVDHYGEERQKERRSKVKGQQNVVRVGRQLVYPSSFHHWGRRDTNSFLV